MSTGQYEYYCLKFGLKPQVRHTDGRGARGIGESKEGFRLVLIQITFYGLGIVIEVEFMLVEGDIPS